jgi:hypothetical protein
MAFDNKHPMHSFAMHLQSVAIRVVETAQPQLVGLDVRHPSAEAVRIALSNYYEFSSRPP